MTEKLSENELLQQRRSKLADLREKGNAYPNSFRRDSLSRDLLTQCEGMSKEDLENKSLEVSIAGRIMLQRIMGKASFITLQDMKGQIQAYIRSNDLPEANMTNLRHGIWGI